MGERVSGPRKHRNEPASLGWVFLDETLPAVSLAGAGLILGAVARMVSKRRTPA